MSRPINTRRPRVDDRHLINGTGGLRRVAAQVVGQLVRSLVKAARRDCEKRDLTVGSDEARLCGSISSRPEGGESTGIREWTRHRLPSLTVASGIICRCPELIRTSERSSPSRHDQRPMCRAAAADRESAASASADCERSSSMRVTKPVAGRLPMRLVDGLGLPIDAPDKLIRIQRLSASSKLTVVGPYW
jgi:hypothetical protein